METTQEDTFETKARKDLICKGCGEEKAKGLVVCWDCFKGGAKPFKSYNGSLIQWLAETL